MAEEGSKIHWRGVFVTELDGGDIHIRLTREEAEALRRTAEDYGSEAQGMLRDRWLCIGKAVNLALREEHDEPTAHERASALGEALGTGASVTAWKLDGQWFVVTSGTDATPWDYAYHAQDVDIGEVSAKKWDYSAWCAWSTPCEEAEVARAYFEATGQRLGTAGSGKAVEFGEKP
jgi:hypothetical protein